MWYKTIETHDQVLAVPTWIGYLRVWLSLGRWRPQVMISATTPEAPRPPGPTKQFVPVGVVLCVRKED